MRNQGVFKPTRGMHVASAPCQTATAACSVRVQRDSILHRHGALLIVQALGMPLSVQRSTAI